MMERAIVHCREVRDLLLEVVSGTTPPDLRRALAQHLERCERCRHEAAALEETAALLRSAAEPSLRDGHWDTFMAGLDRRLQAERRRPLARLVRWIRTPLHAWSTAAATAALVVALMFALVGGQAPARVDSPVVQGVPIQGFMTDSIVDALPAMNASLSVWKAGFGAIDVPYDAAGGD